MTKTAAAFALAFAALVGAAQAQAQVRTLPRPPMLHTVALPSVPFCFKDQADAIRWTNAGFGLLGDVAHDRQAVESYIRALQLAEVGQAADIKAAFDREIVYWQNQEMRLEIRYRQIKDLVEGARNARYCPPPAKTGDGPKMAVRPLIGSSTYEGRTVSVYDNKNGTHTVVTEQGGRTISEVVPNASGR
ncbi:MAG: hypothetical protein ACJ798_06855 [Phenylobacterium sp.]